jgi:peptidoglycan/LPS O-acetylase OafA/YrhL
MRTIRQGNEERSRRVESVRAIAALSVVQYHTMLVAGLGHHPTTLEGRAAGWGISAIYVFFTLSGYLIFRPFARRDYGGGGPVALRKYALNRVVRLLPIYYAAIVTLLILASPAASGEEWWRFLTFSQAYSLHTVYAIDAPTWTLVVELQFYIVLPLLSWLVARVSGRSAVKAALLLALIGVASFAYHVHVLGQPLLSRSFPSNFVFIVTGMIIGVLETQWSALGIDQLPSWATASTTWLLAGIAMWPLTTLVSSSDGIALLASFLIVGSVILPLRSGRVTELLDWRPLAALGIATYSLYIWHVPLIIWLTEHRVLRFRWELSAPIAMVICAAVALVSYRVIEAPFLGLRRRWASTTVEADVARADSSTRN